MAKLSVSQATQLHRRALKMAQSSNEVAASNLIAAAVMAFHADWERRRQFEIPSADQHGHFMAHCAEVYADLIVRRPDLK